MGASQLLHNHGHKTLIECSITLYHIVSLYINITIILAMGYDCGFDVYPRLEPNASNVETYRQFRDEIILKYNDAYNDAGRRHDGKVLEVPTSSDDHDKFYLRFMVGECPQMPYIPNYCNYFLRFSSKVSGNLTMPAEPYIRDVYQIAKTYFGSLIHFWYEICETDDERQWGYYSWQEVNNADDELRKLNAGK